MTETEATNAADQRTVSHVALEIAADACKGASWWQQMAKEVERQRNEAFAEIDRLTARLHEANAQVVGAVMLHQDTIKERDALELKLAQLADWVCDTGGWREFYYATTPPPEGIFDLRDTINPDISERMRAILDAHAQEVGHVQ